MVWYQRCLRMEFWHWGVCSSFSTEIFPSADFLLSSENLPVWKAAASLPLRGRQRSNLRSTFSTHKMETSESFNTEASDQQIPPERSWFRVRVSVRELVFPKRLEKIKKIPFQCKDREINADNVLPPYESDACTAAPAPLLHSSSCPHDRSGTTFCHHSVKHKSDFNLNPCFIHHLYT